MRKVRIKPQGQAKRAVAQHLRHIQFHLRLQRRAQVFIQIQDTLPTHAVQREQYALRPAVGWILRPGYFA